MAVVAASALIRCIDRFVDHRAWVVRRIDVLGHELLVVEPRSINHTDR